MSSPTDVLRDEHRVILNALRVLESAADRLDAGGPLPDGWWDRAVAWLRRFADASHHAKEERALFPAMVKAGIPAAGGPIGVMLAEHEHGRALIRTMLEGETGQRVAAAREYVRLLRQHIDKENEVLFPMAEAVLDEQARRALGREFEAVEVEQGPGASVVAAEAALAVLTAALENQAGACT
ncbi:MAG TPA: hemerythrin domain-containing protein [Candidatus Binatia bacterium]|nr:hemerythrin domain-containing protein [Candidatus Binatia bacterium]